MSKYKQCTPFIYPTPHHVSVSLCIELPGIIQTDQYNTLVDWGVNMCPTLNGHKESMHHFNQQCIVLQTCALHGGEVMGVTAIISLASGGQTVLSTSLFICCQSAQLMSDTYNMYTLSLPFIQQTEICSPSYHVQCTKIINNQFYRHQFI